jgi:TonB family protein
MLSDLQSARRYNQTVMPFGSLKCVVALAVLFAGVCFAQASAPRAPAEESQKERPASITLEDPPDPPPLTVSSAAELARQFEALGNLLGNHSHSHQANYHDECLMGGCMDNGWHIPGAKPPVLIYKTEPEYTAAARAAKIQGEVILRVTIQPDGRVGHISVFKSLEPGLDAKAIKGTRGWRFQPALKDGKPVPVPATIQVSFRLK